VGEDVRHGGAALEVRVEEDPVGQTECDYERAHHHIQKKRSCLHLLEVLVEDLLVLNVEEDCAEHEGDVADHEG
jgi:hypothetical protein